jgi:hypothetical protein
MCEINSYKATLALTTFPIIEHCFSQVSRTLAEFYLFSHVGALHYSRSLASVNEADLHGAATDLAHRGNALHLERLA